MGLHSAMIKGTCSVTVVDCHPDRLKLAESIGAIAIDYSTEDPVQPVMDLTYGMGGDAGCECVGPVPNEPTESPLVRWPQVTEDFDEGYEGRLTRRQPATPSASRLKNLLRRSWRVCPYSAVAWMVLTPAGDGQVSETEESITNHRSGQTKQDITGSGQ